MEDSLPLRPSRATGSLIIEAHQRRNRGDIPGAVDSIERALGIEPNDPLLWLDLAHLRLAEGNYVQAGELAKKAVSLSRSTEDVNASAWRVVGESLRQRGRGAEAQEVETRLDASAAAATQSSAGATRASEEATIRATMTAVARSDSARIRIDYAPGGSDFAVRIGASAPVNITRSEAQATLGADALRKLDTTLRADRTLAALSMSSDDVLSRLSESVIGQRFIDIPIQTALGQAAFMKLAGNTDINALTPSEAMTLLTGTPSSSLPLREAKTQRSADIYDRLNDAIDAGRPITLRSQAEYPGAKQDGLTDNRTYTLVGVKADERVGKSYELTLRNPWGKYMRVDLQGLIESGGLESFTIGASRQQQLESEKALRSGEPMQSSDETRRAALQIAKWVEGLANPAVGAKAGFDILRDLAQTPATSEVKSSSAQSSAAALAQSPVDYITVSGGKMSGQSKPDAAGERTVLVQRDREGLPAGDYRVGRARLGEQGSMYQGMVVYSSPIADSDASLVFIQSNCAAGTGAGRQYVAVRMSSEQIPEIGQAVRVAVGEQSKVDSVAVIDRADLQQGRRIGV